MRRIHGAVMQRTQDAISGVRGSIEAVDDSSWVIIRKVKIAQFALNFAFAGKAGGRTFNN
jgi:hypothetical protein